jgi:hypothetical protein
MGELLLAKEQLETAISLYDPERHRSLAFYYGGLEPGVACMMISAWTLWHLGYPDQALTRGNEALALVEDCLIPLAWLLPSFLAPVFINRAAKQAQLKRL